LVYPKKGFIVFHGAITVGIDEQAKLREQFIEARRSAGLTQVGLADRLGRPQSFVSKYERGERKLDVIDFCEVCRALGIDPVAFLRRFCSEGS
jgi:transcriptional regulator with XRE-family HTH domain